MREYITLIEASTKPAKLETAALPYGLKDLQPVLSADSLEYHYEHLAKGYTKRFNNNEGDSDFNRAGAYLHDKFFAQFRSPKRANPPKGIAAALIIENFKDLAGLKEAVYQAAAELKGSGWVYLSTTGEIKTIKNHAVRTDIALLIDLWEHAYALDYKWDKQAYLNNIWKIINWDVINERL